MPFTQKGYLLYFYLRWKGRIDITWAHKQYINLMLLPSKIITLFYLTYLTGARSWFILVLHLSSSLLDRFVHHQVRWYFEPLWSSVDLQTYSGRWSSTSSIYASWTRNLILFFCRGNGWGFIFLIQQNTLYNMIIHINRMIVNLKVYCYCLMCSCVSSSTQSPTYLESC